MPAVLSGFRRAAPAFRSVPNAARSAEAAVVRRMSVVYRSVFTPCVGVGHAPPCAVRATIIGVSRCEIRSLQQKPGGQRRRRWAKGTRRGRMRAPAACCVGCGTQGRPGRSDSRFALHERSEDRRRCTRRTGAVAAIERATGPTGARAAVQSTVSSGAAGAPALGSTVGPAEVHRAVRQERRSCRCTSARRSATAGDREGGHVRRQCRWQPCAARCRGRRAKAKRRARSEARARVTVPPRHR